METNTSVNYRDFNISDIVSQAWELTKKHFPIFLLGIILLNTISYLPNMASDTMYLNSILENGTIMTQEEVIESLSPAELIGMLGGILLLSIVAALLYCYVFIAYNRMLYRTVHGEKPDLTAALKGAYKGYWPYVGTYLLVETIVIIGVCCCIIPGIYLSVRLMFAPYIKSVHPEKSLSECFSQSWEMTKDHFWDLFLLGIVAVLILFVGFLLCCVGILFTMVIYYFIFGVAYEQLAPSMPEEAVAEGTTTPATGGETVIVTES